MQLFFLIAIGPAVALLAYVYHKDRLEKESRSIMIKLLGFGALSAIPAAVLELVGGLLDAWIPNEYVQKLVEYFLVVALAEEGCKYIMLRKITWRSEEFNCSYDGLLYAVFVSMGFAIIENILYVLFHGYRTGLLRAVTAIPGHCFFGVFMGSQYAKAKQLDYLGESGKAKRHRRMALLIPALIHGAYDFLISLQNAYGYIGFAILLVCLYIFGFRAIKKASREDVYIAHQPVEQPPEQWQEP